MNSPKKAQLSKAVLNITTYKESTEGKPSSASQHTSIDITSLLEEQGVVDVCQINGAWSVGEPGDDLSVEYAVTEPELLALERGISDVIDVAIVNDKQSKAIKKLLRDKFEHFIEEHWAPISKCDVTKEYVDKILDKAMGGEEK